MIYQGTSRLQSLINKCRSKADFTHKLTESTSNYVVGHKSIYVGKNPSMDDTLRDALKYYSEVGWYDSIGGWMDYDGMYYIDANIHISSLEMAKAVGKTFKQKAIYDIKNEKGIML